MRALLIVAAFLLAGCTAAPDASAPLPTFPVAAPVPVLLTVPALNLSAPLTSTGLDPDGSITEPDVNRPEVAAWVNTGPTPGSVGRAVIVGHVNGGGRPGVFADLATLPTGSQIMVTDQDGADHVFVVHEVSQWDKTTFPRGKVYGDTDQPELALVTCGGTFDAAAGHYQDNIIAFAHATS